MTEMRSQSFQVCARFENRKKNEKQKKMEWKEIRLLLSPIYVCHMFIYTCVCLCTFKCDHRGFLSRCLRGSTTASVRVERVSFRYILNSRQNTLTIHLLSLQSVAFRERKRKRERHIHLPSRRETERMSIYFYRQLQKFGKNSFALLNCKIGPQIKIQHLRLPHENKRRLGRILLALMDPRLSYWRECKYAMHGHANGL